jgi:predicted kinase
VRPLTRSTPTRRTPTGTTPTVMTADPPASRPLLIVMAGLPGSGKSTLAGDVARALAAPVLGVDPIEAALYRSGIERDQPAGLAAYVVAEALAAEQLALGMTVVIDAVNDAVPARQQWIDLAQRSGVEVRFLEVRCSDERVHRARLRARQRNLGDFREPTWESVEQRRAGFDGWVQPRLRLDAMADRAHNLRAALLYLERDIRMAE